MVDYCKDNNIILQPVVVYNHTIQARVEGVIGCSDQHSVKLKYAPTNPPVSGLMQLLTTPVNETPCGQNVMTKDNFQLPTFVCSLPSPAHIEQQQFHLGPGSLTICLENTLWSEMDLSGIDSLKVPTFEQTMTCDAHQLFRKIW